jgi:hypothetical protein
MSRKSRRKRVEEEDLSIPAFLKISPEDRLKAWEGVPLTHPSSMGQQTTEAWRVKEDARRAADTEARRQKNAAGLARLREKHPKETYDRKLRRWVPITVTVTEAEPA